MFIFCSSSSLSESAVLCMYSILWMDINSIQDQKKSPFQRLHCHIYNIRRQLCPNMPADRITIFIVELTNDAMESRRILLKDIFEGVGDHKLTVYRNNFTVSDTCTNWLNQSVMPSSCDGAQIMPVSRYHFWRRHRKPRQMIAACIQESPYNAVWSLPEQDQKQLDDKMHR